MVKFHVRLDQKIQFIPKQFFQPLRIILVSKAIIKGDTSDDLGTFGKLGEILFQ